MDILKHADIRELIETSAAWCVSIYMPAHRVDGDQQQDKIRFRNLVIEAQNKLLETGMRRPHVLELLRPAEELFPSKYFWQHQSDGLAVFLSHNFSKVYRLPGHFEEMLFVAKHFHVKPLMPLLNRNERFFILALSMKDVRLFHASRDVIDEVELGPNVPTNLEEAIRLDDPKAFLGYHTSASTPGRQGLRAAVFHGQGEFGDKKKTSLVHFFKEVDRGLQELIGEKDAPMVLAGVGYLLPIYRQSNTYKRLLEKGLEGNPDDLDARDLHGAAWELVVPIFKEEQNLALQRFTRLLGQKSELASCNLEGILNAAHTGRVEILFIPAGVKRWGKYMKDRHRVLCSSETDPDREDLIDLAAQRTLLHSGKVYTVEPEKLPVQELAAIIRYRP